MSRKGEQRAEAAAKRNLLYGSVLGQPWLIHPSGLDTVMLFANTQIESGSLQRDQQPEAIDARPGEPQRSGWMTVRDGVAQLRVYGPLVSPDSWMAWYFQSYQWLSYQLTQMMDDPQVSAVVLTISSPGGHVTGCQEFAALVRSYRGTKPIVAFVEGLACSASYWVASACDEIVIVESSMLGCLGCQVAYLDDSKWLDAVGFREIIVTSSQTPEKNRPPTDDAGLNAWQTMVDDLAEVFLVDVANYRGVDRAHVDAQFGRGAVIVGTRAVDAGLADRIGTYEQLHAELTAGQWESARTSAAPAAAIAAHPSTTRTTMKSNKTRTTAAAFDSGAKVKALVTRDATCTEGDIGDVVEVRDGTFYKVKFGDAEYAWLEESELESSAAAESADDANTDAGDDNAGDAEAQAIAAAAAAAAELQTTAIQSAVKAERDRIKGILALTSRVSLATLMPMIDEDGCTAQTAAHRLMSGAPGSLPTGTLAKLASDEAALTANGALSSVAGAPETPTTAESIIAITKQFNPRAVARKSRD